MGANVDRRHARITVADEGAGVRWRGEKFSARFTVNNPIDSAGNIQ